MKNVDFLEKVVLNFIDFIFVPLVPAFILLPTDIFDLFVSNAMKAKGNKYFRFIWNLCSSLFVGPFNLKETGPA